MNIVIIVIINFIVDDFNLILIGVFSIFVEFVVMLNLIWVNRIDICFEIFWVMNKICEVVMIRIIVGIILNNSVYMVIIMNFVWVEILL